MKWFVVIAWCLLFSGGPLHSHWNPKSFSKDKNIRVVKCLKDQKFKLLKKAVKKSISKGWCSEEKMNLLMDLIFIHEPKVCVEVGAFTGSSILPVAVALKYLKKGHIYAIDAWSNKEATKHLASDDPNKSWWSKVDMREAYSTYRRRMVFWQVIPQCKTVCQSSQKAIRRLRQIDFLHLDGDYSEKGSIRDVALYIPRVRSGGYILFSNVLMSVKSQLTKLEAFSKLFETCEMVCEIEGGNAVLLRKR